MVVGVVMSRPHPARGGACQLIIAITNRRLHVPARNRGVDQYAAPIDLVVPYAAQFDGVYLGQCRAAVEIDSHCSLDCPMPFIAIKKSLTRSWRGSMSKIKSLAIGKGWNKQLRDFNNLMGINVGNKKPAWWLVSNWS